MPINPLDRLLFIANTLQFPSHFPRLGIASLLPAETVLADDTDPEGFPNLVRFEEDHTTWYVERRILADEVAAIFIPDPATIDFSNDDWWNHGLWLSGHELAVGNLISTANQGGRPDPADVSRKYAVLYVLKDARMLNTVTFGSSAADCHEYCPVEHTTYCCRPTYCCHP
jgi:hypothetical protein